MDDTSTLNALILAVDRTLEDQGVDPEIITTDDKISIAIQYVETAGVRERMGITTLPEDEINARLFDTAP